MEDDGLVQRGDQAHQAQALLLADIVGIADELERGDAAAMSVHDARFGVRLVRMNPEYGEKAVGLAARIGFKRLHALLIGHKPSRFVPGAGRKEAAAGEPGRCQTGQHPLRRVFRYGLRERSFQVHVQIIAFHSASRRRGRRRNIPGTDAAELSARQRLIVGSNHCANYTMEHAMKSSKTTGITERGEQNDRLFPSRIV